jgi:glycosyltransferase involved in cell wall biosynthesis
VDERRTITVDADVLGRRRTGEESYVAGLLEGLGGLDLPFRVVAYVRSAAALPPAATAGGVVEAAELAVGSNYARIGAALPRRLHRDRPALHHGNYVLPPGLPCPAVVTVHDASWARLADSMPRADRLAFGRFVPWSARRAARVVTVSEHARADLLALWPWLAPERIVAIPNGVSAAFRPLDDASRRVADRFGIEAPYALALGALQPRKNVPRLLEAWATLKARAPGPELLVLAGKPKQDADRYRALAARFGIADEVRFLGHVKAGEPLVELIAGARALVDVSLYEGFGLPVLEAMACGTPVIATAVGGIPEIVGTKYAGRLVTRRDGAAFASAVREQLAAGIDRAAVRRHAEAFGWDPTTQAQIDLFTRLAGRAESGVGA